MIRMLQNKAENGFTLVEVLVSMMIFAFGILAVINMQLVSTMTNVKSRNMTEGITVAQTKVEQLMAVNYAKLLDQNGNSNEAQTVATSPGLDNDTAATADYSEPYDPIDPIGMTHPNYDIFWNVRTDYPYDGTKTVRVIVRWTEKAIAKRFALDMVRSDGDF